MGHKLTIVSPPSSRVPIDLRSCPILDLIRRRTPGRETRELWTQSKLWREMRVKWCREENNSAQPRILFSIDSPESPCRTRKIDRKRTSRLEHRIRRGNGRKSRRALLLKVLSYTRRHRNARSMRPRDQQLRNEGLDSPSGGQSKGEDNEANRPPPNVQAVGSISDVMPSGTIGEQHQHQQIIAG